MSNSSNVLVYAGKGENEGKGVGFFIIQKPALGVPVL